MKKFISILIIFIMLLSLNACDSQTPKETILQLGETASSDMMDICVYDAICSDKCGDLVPKDGKKFVIVTLGLKFTGKNKFTSRPKGIDGHGAKYIHNIIGVDYNNGYEFTISHDSVSHKNIRTGKWELDSETILGTCDTFEDLEPLSKERYYSFGIDVPSEVVDNTEAPLMIKVGLPTSTKEMDIVYFKVR